MKKRSLKRLLVANRGEIALRIMRSARLLGIETVAVYSEADAESPHVAMADDARLIGPADAAKSYLNIESIVTAAKQSHADSIHPGYGFLSERPDFARAVVKAGITFVGPRAEVMAKLGDKVAARGIAHEAGVPVVAGIQTGDIGGARAFARKAGVPIVVKAAAGGGGRGMRVVADLAQLDSALQAAKREATAAFGDGRVFIEKYLARPRHIEVQLIGDEHGAIVAFGERDCSIQRRHQKIIEESPAPAISDQLRNRIIEAALKVARAASYTNAGTVEFLVEGDDFYFLEVNARLQVEHPITEMRYGCDIVAEQLSVAAGAKVSPPSAPNGHAIEARIYAEDAARGFRPAVGDVIHVNNPAGPGIRFDSHLVQGLKIGSHYDGLLGKLVAWAPTREEARRRMLLALDEFSLLGVRNTAGFLRDLIASTAFERANLSTRFIDEFAGNWHPNDELREHALVAAALAAAGLLASDGTPRDGHRDTRPSGRSPWVDLAGFELWKRQ
ncbi:MAG: acetyl-CoA carboxylase biotin carboxylase subunit [Candidatus Binataceae bacterium]